MSDSKKRKSNEENENPVSSKRLRSDVMKISGRVKSIELENFMCHERLLVQFDVDDNNCFYIGGPNGSGKSALFAALNIGLGGRGNHNDRGNSVKSYIKEGKRSAKIRVTLTNEGQGSHPDYGTVSIIERTINQTSSTYSLKTVERGKERKVSSKKSELDKLMHRYGIQLNNPIFWMSQDRSRHFLQQMKPDKLYEIFIFATELDHTKMCYEKVSQVLEDVIRVSEVFEEHFKNKKTMLEKLKEDRLRRGNLLKDKKDLAALGWYLIWFPLRDANFAIERTEKRKVAALNALEDMKNKQRDLHKTRPVLLNRTNELNEEIQKIAHSTEKASKAVRDKEAERSEAETELHSIERSISDLKKEEKSCAKQIAELEAAIKKKEKENLSSDLAKEKEALETKIEQATTEIQDADACIREAEKELAKVSKEWSTVEEAASTVEEKRRSSEEAIRRAERDMKMCRAMATDALARFGSDVPRLIEVLNKNARSFEKMPLGPLGRYIKVKEKSYTFAVEKCIGPSVESFLLHSQKDRRAFEDLCRQNNIHVPNIFVTNFNIGPHQTMNNEPPSHYDTVDRVIDISNHLVRNTLIDVMGIETTLLMDNDNNARDLLNGHCPPNVRCCFTKSGGKGFGRNAQGNGQYRFYPCLDDAVPRIFVDRMNVDENQVKQIIEQEKKNAQEARNEGDTYRRRMSELEKQKAQWKRQLSDNHKRKDVNMEVKRQAERKLDSMETENEMDNMIMAMRVGMENEEKKKARIAEERAQLGKTREELERKVMEKREEMKECKKVLDKEMERSKPFETELKQVKEELKTLDGLREKQNTSLQKLGEAVTKIDEEFVGLHKAKAEAEQGVVEGKKDPTWARLFPGGVPPRYTDPPKWDEMPQTEEAQKLYNDLDRKVKASETAMGTVAVNDNQFNKLKAEFKESVAYFKRLKKIRKVLERASVHRSEKFPMIQHAITMKLKLSFQRLMSMRHYGGHLRVKNDTKTIEITVHTHKKEGTGKTAREKGAVTQDLKGLSGGERSYTTACFIMSLWEIMEAPFRCMDEFDVFMDMVNRKMVMELLVKLATEQFAENQFIFFTPQGIRELGQREGVQIFEMPKVRD